MLMFKIFPAVDKTPHVMFANKCLTKSVVVSVDKGHLSKVSDGWNLETLQLYSKFCVLS